MESTNQLKTRKIVFLIMISLLVMLLTWSWFEKRIAAIDEKIEILHTK